MSLVVSWITRVWVLYNLSTSKNDFGQFTLIGTESWECWTNVSASLHHGSTSIGVHLDIQDDQVILNFKIYIYVIYGIL